MIRKIKLISKFLTSKHEKETTFFLQYHTQSMVKKQFPEPFFKKTIIEHISESMI